MYYEDKFKSEVLVPPAFLEVMTRERKRLSDSGKTRASTIDSTEDHMKRREED